MIKLTKLSTTQNQKSAEKRHTFDFSPSHKDEEITKSEQNISINNISKEKGQSCTNRIDPNKQTVHQLKKGGLLMM